MEQEKNYYLSAAIYYYSVLCTDQSCFCSCLLNPAYWRCANSKCSPKQTKRIGGQRSTKNGF